MIVIKMMKEGTKELKKGEMMQRKRGEGIQGGRRDKRTQIFTGQFNLTNMHISEKKKQ